MQLTSLEGLPPPPAWLGDEARDEWSSLGVQLLKHKLLNPLTLRGFAWLCAVSGQIIETLKRNESVDAELLKVYRGLRGDFWLARPVLAAGSPVTTPALRCRHGSQPLAAKPRTKTCNYERTTTYRNPTG